MLADPHIAPEIWLKQKIALHESQSERILIIPKREDGGEYTIEGLYGDQKEILAVVLDTLHDFLYTDNLRRFKPLRVILNGQGGSGKSVVINTIVAVMRRMFGFNDVVKVVAPTGVAAANVNGETFHHLLTIGIKKQEYKRNTMSTSGRKRLIKKFKMLLAMIIDERSLVTSKILGTAESYISETIHGGGHHSSQSWGGLPILIIAGDDYQLPGIGEGPLTALFSRAGGKMTCIGRSTFLDCAQNVMELGGSKRMNNKENKNRELLNRLRIGEGILEEDVQKLMSLHVDEVLKRHGKAYVDEIYNKAMFLYYRNDKKQRHNLVELIKRCSPSNPVAVVRARSHGSTAGKGIRRHFDSDVPAAALLCRDAKVALSNRNFYPSWGLHNGACGTINEIIFAPGENPNHGALPKYVVVDMPLYHGPIWDVANPTVSTLHHTPFTHSIIQQH